MLPNGYSLKGSTYSDLNNCFNQLGPIYHIWYKMLYLRVLWFLIQLKVLYQVAYPAIGVSGAGGGRGATLLCRKLGTPYGNIKLYIHESLPSEPCNCTNAVVCIIPQEYDSLNVNCYLVVGQIGPCGSGVNVTRARRPLDRATQTMFVRGVHWSWFD